MSKNYGYRNRIKWFSQINFDLSKTFDCILYEILIAKLDSYGLDRNLLKYISSYLDNRKAFNKLEARL